MKRQFSQSLLDVIMYSKEEAIRLGNDYLGPEHLFLGILRNTNCEAVDILKELDISTSELRKKIDNTIAKSDLSLL